MRILSHRLGFLGQNFTVITPTLTYRYVEPSEIWVAKYYSPNAVLQIAMGWTNSHLHRFRIQGQFFAEPSPDYLDLEVEDERLFHLSQAAPEVGAQFIYEYDIGDSREHTLVVEQILPPDPGVAYPRCIAGKRACPLEDVGGAPGYAEFLIAIHDPRHPEHAEYTEWVGGRFDP
jgi:hypothetical protein